MLYTGITVVTGRRHRFERQSGFPCRVSGEVGNRTESESGGEENNHFLESDSSSSVDSDDNLMVSQELRPGFSAASGFAAEALGDIIEEHDVTDSDKRLDAALDALGPSLDNKLNGSVVKKRI